MYLTLLSNTGILTYLVSEELKQQIKLFWCLGVICWGFRQIVRVRCFKNQLQPQLHFYQLLASCGFVKSCNITSVSIKFQTCQQENIIIKRNPIWKLSFTPLPVPKVCSLRFSTSALLPVASHTVCLEMKKSFCWSNTQAWCGKEGRHCSQWHCRIGLVRR